LMLIAPDGQRNLGNQGISTSTRQGSEEGKGDRRRRSQNLQGGAAVLRAGIRR
jgi:hypothetical protein